MKGIGTKMKDEIITFFENINLKNISNISEVNGGLFNRVYSFFIEDKQYYLKSFEEKAKFDGYPPMPTSAKQRYYIAEYSQKLFCDINNNFNYVEIPKIVFSDNSKLWIIMDKVSGVDFYEKITSDLNMAQCVDIIKVIIKMLANIHHLKLEEDLNFLNSNSYDFKEYKVNLQYVKLLPYLHEKHKKSANIFIANYLADKSCLMHGDINSKNILVNEGNMVSIIDFEQGQLGDGIYDVAYIVSEFVLNYLKFEEEEKIEKHIQNFLNIYCSFINEYDFESINTNYRIHLAFQVLYRLVGPSKQVWSGHLNEETKILLNDWSLNQLVKWLGKTKD